MLSDTTEPELAAFNTSSDHLCPCAQVKSVTAPATVAVGVPKWTSVKAVSIYKFACQ